MSKLVVMLYKFIDFLNTMRIPVLPYLLNLIFIRILFSCQIGLGAKLGKNVSLGYGGLGISSTQKSRNWCKCKNKSRCNHWWAFKDL